MHLGSDRVAKSTGMLAKPGLDLPPSLAANHLSRIARLRYDVHGSSRYARFSMSGYAFRSPRRLLQHRNCCLRQSCSALARLLATRADERPAKPAGTNVALAARAAAGSAAESDKPTEGSISSSSFAIWEVRTTRPAGPPPTSFARSAPKRSICSTRRPTTPIPKSPPARTTCCGKSPSAGFKPTTRRPFGR